jgi:hypothetical protein
MDISETECKVCELDLFGSLLSFIKAGSSMPSRLT